MSDENIVIDKRMLVEDIVFALKEDFKVKSDIKEEAIDFEILYALKDVRDLLKDEVMLKLKKD